jgi:hypothetical protein
VIRSQIYAHGPSVPVLARGGDPPEPPGALRARAVVLRRHTGHSSLKERGRVNGGFYGGFGRRRACVTSVSCSLIAAVFLASGWAGQGPGGARPAKRAPEASLR